MSRSQPQLRHLLTVFCDKKLLQYKENIIEIITNFIDDHEDYCHFLLCHKNLKIELSSAKQLFNSVIEIDNIEDLNGKLSDFIGDQTNGDTDIHSLRTKLQHLSLSDKNPNITLDEVVRSLRK